MPALTIPASLSRTPKIVKKVKPGGWTRLQIERFVTKLADKLNYSGDGSNRLMLETELLVSRLGGRVTRRDLWDGEPGLAVNGVGSFTITISPYLTAGRVPFAILFNIGLYILHYVVPKRTGPFWFDREVVGQAATEASWFAQAAILPAKQFVKVAKQNSHSVARIAAKTGLPQTLVDSRGRNLSVRLKP